MQVKLKVLSGSNAGREVAIAVPEFLIGRGDGCHLRPRTDLVSRQHCVLTIGEDGVNIRDLDSRNGTYVNDERITEVTQLKLGDRLRIGRLEFEVLIDHSLGGTKRPKVRDVKEAAARTRAAEPAEGELDITDWLEEADEVERMQRMTDPDTRQFKFDDTDLVQLEKAAAEAKGQSEDEESEDEPETAVEKLRRMKSKEPGKLPERPGQAATDSREAATNMLKQFFNRR